MLLGRIRVAVPSSARCAAAATQRHFLATKAKKKGGGGGKKNGQRKVAAKATPAAPAVTSTIPPAARKSVTSGGGAGFTKSEMLAARQARKASVEQPTGAADTSTATAAGKGVVEGAAAGAGAGTGGAERAKWGWGAKTLAATLTGLATLGVAWQVNPDAVRRLLDDSPIDHLAAWAMDKYLLYSSPAKEKLLPDLAIPPGSMAKPTLVLGLEGTLVGTTYTRKKGWRIARRPGLDDFLKEMWQLYEIVIFTDSHGGAEEWINQMDPHGLVSQKVYRDGTRYINGKHVKDLTALNRPLSQVVIVDNNPDCISMQPENAITVKTYSLEDGSDPTLDTVLYELTPILRALATQGVEDFRDVLRPHVGKDYTAVVSEYNSKVNAIRQKEEAERGRGFGGFVRDIGSNASSMRGGMMTSKDVVGEAPDTLSPAMASVVASMGSNKGGGEGGGSAAVAPVPAEKKGGFWKSFDEGSKEREENETRKNEAFQKVMEKRHEQETARREAAAQQSGQVA